MWPRIALMLSLLLPADGRTTHLSQWVLGSPYSVFPSANCSTIVTAACSCNATMISRVSVVVTENCGPTDTLTSTLGAVTEAGCNLTVDGPMTLEAAVDVLRDVRVVVGDELTTQRSIDYAMYPTDLPLGDNQFLLGSGGHMYTVLGGRNTSYVIDAANACANTSLDWLGMTSYLAAFEYGDEASHMHTVLPAGTYWIGGSDAGNDGKFMWFTGRYACRWHNASLDGYVRSGCDLGVDMTYDETGDCDAVSYPQCGGGLAFSSAFPWSQDAGAMDASNGDFVVFDTQSSNPGGRVVGMVSGTNTPLCEWGGSGASCVRAEPFGRLTLLAHEKMYDRRVAEWTNFVEVHPFPNMTCDFYNFTDGCGCSTTTVGKVLFRVERGGDGDHFVSDDLVPDHEMQTPNPWNTGVTAHLATTSKSVTPVSLREALRVIRDVRLRLGGGTHERVVEYLLFPLSGWDRTALNWGASHAGHFQLYYGTRASLDQAMYKCAQFSWFGLTGYVTALETTEEIKAVLTVLRERLLTVSFASEGEAGTYRWIAGPDACRETHGQTGQSGDALRGRSGCYVRLRNGLPCDHDHCTEGRPYYPEDYEEDYAIALGASQAQGVLDARFGRLALRSYSAGDMFLLCEFGGVGRSCLGANPTGRTTYMKRPRRHQLTHGVWQSGKQYPLFPYIECRHYDFTAPCSCNGTNVSRVTVTVVEGCNASTDVLQSAAATNVTACRVDVVATQTLEDALGVLRGVQFMTSGSTEVARVVEYMLHPVGNTDADVVATYDGHVYARLPGQGKGSVVEALDECALGSREWFGLVGYLAALETDAEGALLLARLDSGVQHWVGGADVGAEGTFKWFTGPAACGPHVTTLAGYARSGCFLGVDAAYDENGDCDAATFAECAGGTVFESGFAWAAGEPAGSGEDFVLFGAPAGGASATKDAGVHVPLCEWGGVGESCLGADPYGRTTLVSQSQPTHYERTITDWRTGGEYLLFPDLSCANFSFRPPCSCSTTEVGQVHVVATDGCDIDELVAPDGTYAVCTPPAPYKYGDVHAKGTNFEKLFIEGVRTIESAIELLRGVRLRVKSSTVIGYEVARVVEYRLIPRGHVVHRHSRNIDTFWRVNYVGFHEGHAYSIIWAQNSWVEGWDLCAETHLDFFGAPGYAHVLDTQDELGFLRRSLFTIQAGAGVSDAGETGNFRYMLGPDACAPHDLGKRGHERVGCFIGATSFSWTRPPTACDVSLFPQCAGGVPVQSWFPWESVAGFPKLRLGLNGVFFEPISRYRKGPGLYKDTETSHAMSVVCEFGGVGEMCVAPYFGKTTLKTVPRRHQLTHGVWQSGKQYPLFPYIECRHYDFTAPCSCNGTNVSRVTVTVVEGCNASTDVLQSAAATNVTACRVDVVATQTLEDALGVLRGVQFMTSGSTEVARVVEYMLHPVGNTDADVVATYDGHVYARLPGQGKGSVVEALDECALGSREWFGLVGYLAALETDAEGALLLARLDSGVQHWVGGADVGAEGTFKWFTGPAACGPHVTTLAGYARSGCFLGVDAAYDENGDCDAATFAECAGGTVFESGFAWAAGEPAGSGEDFVLFGAPAGGASATKDAGVHVPLCEWGGVGESCLGADPYGRTTFSAQVDTVPMEGYTRVTSGWLTHQDYAVFPDVSCAFYEVNEPCTCDTYEISRTDVKITGCTGSNINVYAADGITKRACGQTLYDNTRKSLEEAFKWLRGLRFISIMTSTVATNVTVSFELKPFNPGAWLYVGEVAGHMYWTSTYTSSWYQARQECSEADYFGLKGYLATMESVEVEALLYATPTWILASSQQYWLGGLDIGTEGTWKWVTGLEGCAPYDPIIGYNGCELPPFSIKYDETSDCDANVYHECAGGQQLDGALTWKASEPSHATGEDMLAWTVNGLIDEAVTRNSRILCEFGGFGRSCLGKLPHGESTFVNNVRDFETSSECICGLD